MSAFAANRCVLVGVVAGEGTVRCSPRREYFVRFWLAVPRADKPGVTDRLLCAVGVHPIAKDPGDLATELAGRRVRIEAEAHALPDDDGDRPAGVVFVAAGLHYEAAETPALPLTSAAPARPVRDGKMAAANDHTLEEGEAA